MTRESDETTVERQSPEVAFALLGNETRVAIVRTLSGFDDPVAFSELREAVGTQDSGQFNYHLGKLVGSFVRRTDDGYTLTLAGDRVVGALMAGAYTATVSFDPIEMDAECPECGAPLVVEYADEHVVIRCTDCDDWRSMFPFPPGTLDQFERADLPAVFDRWLRSTFERIVAGFCSNCGGRMDGRLDLTGDDPRVIYDCRQCREKSSTTATHRTQYHSATVAFGYDHGIDVMQTPMWELAHDLDTATEVVDEDPPTVRVALTLDEETLTLTLDEETLTLTLDEETLTLTLDEETLTLTLDESGTVTDVARERVKSS